MRHPVPILCLLFPNVFCSQVTCWFMTLHFAKRKLDILSDSQLNFYLFSISGKKTYLQRMFCSKQKNPLLNGNLEDFLDASHFLIAARNFLSFLHPSFSNLYWKGIYLIARNKKETHFEVSVKTLTSAWKVEIWQKSKVDFSTKVNLNWKQWLCVSFV